LSKGWFAGDGSEALAKLVSALAADASPAELTAHAAGWLAQFPIAAALDGGRKSPNGSAAPELPADGWPFPARVDASDGVPWLVLL